MFVTRDARRAGVAYLMRARGGKTPVKRGAARDHARYARGVRAARRRVACVAAVRCCLVVVVENHDLRSMSARRLRRHAAPCYFIFVFER